MKSATSKYLLEETIKKYTTWFFLFLDGYGDGRVIEFRTLISKMGYFEIYNYHNKIDVVEWIRSLSQYNLFRLYNFFK